MHLSTRQFPHDQLTALKFSEENFRAAARTAVENDIPVDAPGYSTLIVRKCDKALFKVIRWEEEHGVANPEKIDPRQLTKLRRYRNLTK